MNRDKNLPLTETTYYVLLALLEPAHGYLIMQKVEELSNHQVKIAAGTLYGAVENLLKQGLIESVKVKINEEKCMSLRNAERSIAFRLYENAAHYCGYKGLLHV